MYGSIIYIVVKYAIIVPKNTPSIPIYFVNIIELIIFIKAVANVLYLVSQNKPQPSLYILIILFNPGIKNIRQINNTVLSPKRYFLPIQKVIKGLDKCNRQVKQYP